MAGKLDIFQALVRRMQWLGQRQNVLSQNIANTDTPGYRPQDLKQGPFERVLARAVAAVQPAATHPAHLQGRSAQPGAVGAKDQRHTFETAPSGNAVVIDEQLIKVAETQMSHQTMTNLYRKHTQMLRAALGSREG